jgi:predicted nucleic acid-binding protein
MRFLDTNIILRYLTRPRTPLEQAKYRACSNLFRRVEQGQEQITTCEAVVTEVLYVLCSPRQYNLSRQDAATRLRPILALRGLRLPQKRLYLRALELFVAHPRLDFEDAVIVAHMERRGIGELLSYDTGFDRVATVQRQEP